MPAKSSAADAGPRPPSLRRWANVVLRAAHLVAVILLGAALLGAPVDAGTAAIGLVLSGGAMLVLDTWSHPDHLREVSGLAVLLKLALAAWMAADAAPRAVLFWFIVAASVVFAHAPARFRHALWCGKRRAADIT